LPGSIKIGFAVFADHIRTPELLFGPMPIWGAAKLRGN